MLDGLIFSTCEHLYHYMRFKLSDHEQSDDVAERILRARSAHDAFKFAQDNKLYQVAKWDTIKFWIMREILKLKVVQHEYVRIKLLNTGERKLIENSWRDNFWGVGAEGLGNNYLGRLWMEVRDDVRGGLY